MNRYKVYSFLYIKYKYLNYYQIINNFQFLFHNKNFDLNKNLIYNRNTKFNLNFTIINLLYNWLDFKNVVNILIHLKILINHIINNQILNFQFLNLFEFVYNHWFIKKVLIILNFLIFLNSIRFYKPHMINHYFMIFIVNILLFNFLNKIQ